MAKKITPIDEKRKFMGFKTLVMVSSIEGGGAKSITFPIKTAYIKGDSMFVLIDGEKYAKVSGTFELDKMPPDIKKLFESEVE